MSARHQETQPPTLETHPPILEPAISPAAASALLEPADEDDFSFVPDPPASARNAAADLRSALE
jgi:hypothetical protein